MIFIIFMLLIFFYFFIQSKNKNIYLKDLQLGYIHKKNTTFQMKATQNKDIKVSINRYGFRDYEKDYKQKDFNSYRILALGDSFLFGWGIPFEQTALVKLEKKLNKNSKRKYDIFKAGVCGYGPQQENILLKQLYPLVKPEHVIVFIYTGNDIRDVLVKNQHLVHRGNIYFNQNSLIKWKGYYNIYASNWEWLPARSVGYKNSWINIKSLFKLSKSFDSSIQEKAKIDFCPLTILEHGAFLIKNYPALFDNGIEILIKNLKDIQDFCLKNNMKSTFVLIPMPMQVNQDDLLKFMKIFSLDNNDIDINLPQSKIIQVAKKYNIDNIIDLTPILKKHSKQKRLYYEPYSDEPASDHWNSHGHYIVSQFLYEYLNLK